jgi:nuclear pore complex protein Nup160
MARPAVTPTLYQEVQLSTLPASPASILKIDTTGNNSQAVTLFGAGRKRGYTEISELDEESYARKHLASEASVYFRRKSKYPRSFLWRVLDDRRLLEVQCVDLVHERDDLQREGSLTFHIELPTEIVRRGVAFADPEETDALEVFVLTTGNDLYTITLKADLLARDSPPSEFDPSTAVKKYSPSSFG